MARAETGGMVDSEHARRNEDDVMLFFMEELDDCNRTPSQETGGKYPAYGKVEGRCASGFSLTMYRHIMDSEWPTHSYNPIFRKIYLKIIRCDVRIVHQATLS